MSSVIVKPDTIVVRMVPGFLSVICLQVLALSGDWVDSPCLALLPVQLPFRFLAEFLSGNKLLHFRILHIVLICLRESLPGGVLLGLCVLIPGLKVVDGADDADDIGGKADVLHDIVHGLISHGAFVDGIAGNGGGIHALHLRLELGQGEALLGGGAAHEPACAVRGGLVPIVVASAGADE